MQLNYCLIGFTLMLSGFYMSFLNRDSDHFRRFYSLLDSSQKDIYENIVKERLLIYIAGTIIGTAISYYYYSTHKNDKFIICKLLVIVNVIKLGFYYVFPKSPLMLYSLTSKDQTDAWADIYSEMKNRWIMSLAFGFFAYVFLSLALVK